MISFLIKGLLRDRSRSLFPLFVIIAGVTLTVIMHCWIEGMFVNMTQSSANFQSGHVKVTTRAYAKEASQLPNDLAITGLDTLLQELSADYPGMNWASRIRFGGLLDIPDADGETRVQGPALGLGIELHSSGAEKQRLNLTEALDAGSLPEKPGDMLISSSLAEKLGVKPGDAATLIGSTMHGSMAMANFSICGTIRFGMNALDRGAFIVDLSDAQIALDMQNSTGEILGFFNDGYFDRERSEAMGISFNARQNADDEFAPRMEPLSAQGGLGDLLDLASVVMGVIIFMFIFIMFIVLWNAGLMGSIRRYGEIGVRMAIGEPKSHLYGTLLIESMVLGLIGSIIGTAIGLSIAYYLQKVGFDMGSMMKDSSVMMSNVMRARITPTSWLVGFLPGLIATVLGTAIAGIGIYKRQTAQLFKELEV
ncbi:MAG: ABC transporter permease [Calditrichia bacterium]